MHLAKWFFPPSIHSILLYFLLNIRNGNEINHCMQCEVKCVYWKICGKKANNWNFYTQYWFPRNNVANKKISWNLSIHITRCDPTEWENIIYRTHEQVRIENYTDNNNVILELHRNNIRTFQNTQYTHDQHSSNFNSHQSIQCTAMHQPLLLRIIVRLFHHCKGEPYDNNKSTNAVKCTPGYANFKVQAHISYRIVN